MKWNDHSRISGLHAFLGASKYHWINYNEEKLESWNSRGEDFFSFHWNLQMESKSCFCRFWYVVFCYLLDFFQYSGSACISVGGGDVASSDFKPSTEQEFSILNPNSNSWLSLSPQLVRSNKDNVSIKMNIIFFMFFLPYKKCANTKSTHRKTQTPIVAQQN